MVARLFHLRLFSSLSGLVEKSGKSREKWKEWRSGVAEVEPRISKGGRGRATERKNQGFSEKWAEPSLHQGEEIY